MSNADGVTIELEMPWKVLSGTIHGLDQQALTGTLLINARSGASFASLDGVLERMFGSAAPPLPSVTGEAHALASRVLQWLAAVQVYSKIPVSGAQYLGEPVRRRGGMLAVPVAAPCFARPASGECLHWVVAVINRILAGPVDSARLDADLNRLRDRLRPYSLSGLNMFHFVRAALDLDMPVSRLTGQVFRVGTGCRSRLLNSSFTDRTSHIGVALAHNKLLTAEILRCAGLPAPEHLPAADAARAIEAAATLGYPVVVKPADQEQGRGVAAGLIDAEDVRRAFAEALKVSKIVLVEKHVHGRDYRLTVFGGRVIKIENRVAGGVTGDGVSTVEQLVAAAQQTPRLRKIFRDTGKMILQLDPEALGMVEESGMTAASVPEKDFYVVLRRKNNISTGGLQIGIAPEEAHPDNLALAIRAAHEMRLDFAGIDLIIPDIAKSWLDVGGIVCEVNAQPQIGALTSPTIYRDILAEMMEGESRIPTHLVIGHVAIDAAHRLAEELGCNGLSTPEGVWMDGRKLVARVSSAFHAAQIMLNDIDSRAALAILPADEILALGLPTDRFQTIRFMAHAAEGALSEPDKEEIRRRARPHADHLIEQ